MGSLNTFLFLIICGLAIITINISPSNGQLGTTTHEQERAVTAPQEKSCRAVFTELNRFQIRQVGICTNTLGYKTGKEKVQKAACILKCVMQNGGLMSQDGVVSIERLNQYVKDKFPVSLQTKAHSIFNPCLSLLNVTNVQSNATDENCKSYEPFVRCMSRNFNRLCRK